MLRCGVCLDRHRPAGGSVASWLLRLLAAAVAGFCLPPLLAWLAAGGCLWQLLVCASRDVRVIGGLAAGRWHL